MRRLVLCLAVVSSLAACGPSGGTSAPSSPEPSAEANGGTRTIEHALGSTQVPLEPQRVVVGRRGTLPILLDLGVVPVGSHDATAIFGQPFHPLITDEVEAAGVEPIPAEGTVMQLEPIAALQPDLIVAASVDIESIYDELSAIAPTVALDFDFERPLNNVVPIGETVGRGEQAAQLLAEFEAEVADAAAGLGDPGTVSLVGRFGPQDLRLYRSGNLVGQLVEELGGQVVPTVDELPRDGVNVLHETISEEQLLLADGDALVVFANPGAAGDEEIAGLEAIATYEQLPAVRAGRVLRLDPQLPFLTAGLDGVRVALEEVVSFLGRGGQDGGAAD